MKLPISSILVGYNEADLLRRSLPSLQFCDEIIYFDLGSEDDSVLIAESFGAKIIFHQKVPGCEWIHSAYATSTKHKWVLVTDPDEVLDEETVDNIYGLFDRNILTPETGCVSVPIFYYLKNKKLAGTTWGGEKRRVLMAHNERFKFSPIVHNGRELLNGFVSYDIPSDGKNGLHHYWVTSYRKMLEKHVRYLNNEAKSKFLSGQRITAKELLIMPLKAFKYSFYHKKGYRDGFTGLFLSCFWAWYETAGNYRLLNYQRNNSKASK